MDLCIDQFTALFTGIDANSAARRARAIINTSINMISADYGTGLTAL
jgi:hypothetical protein